MRIFFHFINSFLYDWEGKSEGFTGSVVGVREEERRREKGGRGENAEEEKVKDDKPCKRQPNDIFSFERGVHNSRLNGGRLNVFVIFQNL